ncbi:protein TIFY 4B-like [Hibiscus syriacus]|uniref:protein TIFY 4B-like n=1 Tax=Hibiscus syriacus TaxID=106335 RepID=UPI001924D6FC|nr:protein TIFY 4B-like [Hibiscus syriacus]
METVVTTEATTTASSSSILDKPLIQLTEEDISQLTREDCRKFLKEKGMRRPSWNKSQAIQQVISLKALLESNEDSTACALRKIVLCPPPPPVPPQNVASNSGNSAKETVLGEEGPLKTAPVVEMSCQGSEKNKKTLSPRSRWETNELGGQMTLFYCGKINVYDGVPLAKAHAIMRLAASPIDFTLDNLCNGNADLRSFLGHAQEAEDKNNLVASNALNSHTIQTGKMIEYQQHFREKGNNSRDSDIDGQMNRKVSLQRHLEKRKDRGRFSKGRKHAGQTSSSFEMYLSQQIGTHHSNGQSTRSETSSLPQSTVPHVFCSSADNQAKLVNLSVDLNDESGKEH